VATLGAAPAVGRAELYLERELESGELSRVKEHTHNCWECRRQLERLEKGVYAFVDFRREILIPSLPHLPEPTGLLRRLREEASRPPGPPLWRAVLAVLKSLSFRVSRPVWISGTISIITALAFLHYSILEPPQIEAAEFLNRAAAAALPAPQRPHTVLYQKVRIRRGSVVFDRVIAHGARVPADVSADSATKNAMSLVKMDWDAPLRAKGFSAWRDTLSQKEDHIFEEPDALVLLTTPVGNQSSEVRFASLTVNRDDWHPVAEHVEFWSQPALDVTEVSREVRVLPSATETVPETIAKAGTSARTDVSAIAGETPQLPTDFELDEAELETRLALNHLHADTGERVYMVRNADGIEVRGVVTTNPRREELILHLNQLPHVQTSILNVEELDSHPPSYSHSGSKQPIQVYTIEAQVSPLEQYIRENNLSMDQLASLSQSLLDGSLRVQQAEVHLLELGERFQRADGLPTKLLQKLEILTRTYISTIEGGIDENVTILQSVGLETTNQPGAPAESNLPQGDIEQQIRRYQGLCQEMITSGSGQSRTAAVIANELMNASGQIRLHLTRMYAGSPKIHQ
jgi:hypothetical protein